ncbi:MAG: endonuclease/exonuclease/phosphatase family protein, partial [Bacteroidota bacterium]
LLWVFSKDRYLVLSLACLILGSGYIQTFIGLAGSAKSTPKAQQLSILSYNLYGLRYLPNKGKTTRGKDDREYIEFLDREMRPLDLWCVQENNNHLCPGHARHLELPHQFSERYQQTAIFSRYPILARGELAKAEGRNQSVWVDIDVDGMTIRVYAIHLSSTKISSTTQRLAESGDLQEKETWRDIRSVIGSYKRASQRRAKEAVEFAEHIAQSPYPVIVCGDLNETPVSFVYRTIRDSRALQDAFAQAGSGLGTTYAGVIPALRIDFIFVDPFFQVRSHQIRRVLYSDHYPVSTIIEWGEKVGE